jgi:hypothetical protein
MFLLWLLEWSLRPLVVGNLHPLGEQYFTGNTPGMIGTPYVGYFLNRHADSVSYSFEATSIGNTLSDIFF